MEKSPLLDRDWLISVLQVLAADEITNYSITMMADEKNDYFKTASRHTKIYDIPVYNHKELSPFITANLLQLMMTLFYD